MKETFLQSFHSPELERFEKDIREHISVTAAGVTESQAAVLACRLAEEGRRVMLVLPNDLHAVKAGEDAAQLLPGLTAGLTGGEIDLTRGASSHENSWRRLEALTRCVTGAARLFVVSAEALQLRMGNAERFRSSIIQVKLGDRMLPRELMERLVRMGYERVEMVEGKGQVAMRGAILDVYPPVMNTCLRIEFFDDEVDGIRELDCISQRSQAQRKSAEIPPACEVLIPTEEAEAAAERMRSAIRRGSQLEDGKDGRLFDDLPPLPEDDDELADYFDTQVVPRVKGGRKDPLKAVELERRQSGLMQQAEQMAGGIPFRRINSWLTVLTDDTSDLLDWFRPDAVLLYQADQIRERAQERLQGFQEDLAGAIERGEAVREQESLLMNWDELLPRLTRYAPAHLCGMLRGQAGIASEDALDLEARGIQGYQGQLKLLTGEARDWMEKGLGVLLLSGGVARGQRLAQNLAENGLLARFIEEPCLPEPGHIVIGPQTLSKGFIWEKAGICVISDADIWGSGYRKSKARRNSGEKIAAFTDLKKGDYVVHEDHGVGVYQGTVRLQSEGIWHEYLLIQYAGTDKLYVPVEQLGRVQRYIGNPQQPPKLNKIGGGEWGRQKSKVKEGLRTLAFDLVELYARRARQTGYAFGKDTIWQREFEDQFPYELTPDQAQSVKEITDDMESPRNMDRLLCGDVGYGKTEVSLRAAFKAVNDGKQVALLAPTTILAQQHYNTVIKRFANFPVRAEVISRFRTAKEIREILQRLAAGEIDILVGTHRLLAKDVKFKDLGLLIVDEEQRFGVAHKEIIKNMKNQMDVLTLSATPIPRTLHMSMVGIRDMSVLETPPEERLPVQTHVVDYSDALIRDAILRELGRGGQVYFLYNRVNSIERFHERLRQLVPEARIGMAHGQMKEHGLEDVMMDFYAGSYDVLLCTTIIESGLDVPTANTLIVFDADRFGLSQLYQLRGRVGRSNRQAYAYFTVRPDKMLSETAQQRLSAIREFTEFGAGFRIAMRDLEIRGAGNILGPEQHGHLSTVGYDMYCKLIEETLNEVQGVKHTEKPLETRVDIKVDAFIPVDYIADEHQRMEMYKRIAAITDEESREDVIDELSDRFGDYPATVEALLDISQMRSLANSLGALLVNCRSGNLNLRIDPKYAPDGGMLLRACFETDPRLFIQNTAAPALILRLGGRYAERDILRLGLTVLKKLTARLHELEEEEAAKDAH